MTVIFNAAFHADQMFASSIFIYSHHDFIDLGFKSIYMLVDITHPLNTYLLESYLCEFIFLVDSCLKTTVEFWQRGLLTRIEYVVILVIPILQFIVICYRNSNARTFGAVGIFLSFV